MKRNIISIVLILLLAIITGLAQTNQVIAQTKETTSSASKTSETATHSGAVDSDVKIFKDKIASKVAELTKNNKNIKAGYITSKNDDVIELLTDDKKTFTVQIDKTITNFYSLEKGSKKEISLKNLKVDDFIIVSGPFIENSINANNIYKDQEHIVKSGKIIDIDKKDFTIQVMTLEKDTYLLDIEKFTKQYTLNVKTLKIGKIGFSKIKLGDTVNFVCQKTRNLKLNEKTIRVSASKILIISQEYFNNK